MVKFICTLKEDLQRIVANITFDYATQLFTVSEDKTNTQLFKGAEVETSNWLTELGAKSYTPRATSTYANNPNLEHLNATGLLELLRIRLGQDSIKVELHPRADLVKLLDIEDSKLQVKESVNESAVTDLSVELDQDDVKKLVINKVKNGNFEVHTVNESGKYHKYIMTESYCNLMFSMLNQAGYEFDREQIKESLNFNGATVFAPEESKVEKLIETQTAKYESSNLGNLSSTYVKVRANAKANKWTVSEIKESKDGYSFEVLAEKGDSKISDTHYMSEFLTESVKFNRNTSIKESNDLIKTAFAVTKGLSVNEALDSLLGNKSKIEEQNIFSKAPDSPRQLLFRVKLKIGQGSDAKVYKISEVRAVSKDAAKEYFLTQNPEYKNRSLEFEYVDATKENPLRMTEATQQDVDEFNRLVNKYGFSSTNPNKEFIQLILDRLNSNIEFYNNESKKSSSSEYAKKLNKERAQLEADYAAIEPYLNVFNGTGELTESTFIELGSRVKHKGTSEPIGTVVEVGEGNRFRVQLNNGVYMWFKGEVLEIAEELGEITTSADMTPAIGQKQFAKPIKPKVKVTTANVQSVLDEMIENHVITEAEDALLDGAELIYSEDYNGFTIKQYVKNGNSFNLIYKDEKLIDKSDDSFENVKSKIDSGFKESSDFYKVGCVYQSWDAQDSIKIDSYKEGVYEVTYWDGTKGSMTLEELNNFIGASFKEGTSYLATTAGKGYDNDGINFVTEDEKTSNNDLAAARIDYLTLKHAGELTDADMKVKYPELCNLLGDDNIKNLENL